MTNNNNRRKAVANRPKRRPQRRTSRLVTTTVKVANRPRRQRRVRQGLRNSAPVAVGLVGRMNPLPQSLKPVCLQTTDFLATVTLGATGPVIVYNALLAPQELEPQSRGRLFSRTFAQYRVKSAKIRVVSSISTAAGGQIGVFYDPNAATNWLAGSTAIGGLSSMPVQGIASAWEGVEIDIPKAELGRFTELFTQEDTSETLKTRWGQLIIVTYAPPTVTPTGSGQVTVWVDAEYEFYEPNATNIIGTLPVINYSGGNWNVTAAGVVQPFGGAQITVGGTVYRTYPAMNGLLFANDLNAEFLSMLPGTGNPLVAFSTFSAALLYAQGDAGQTFLIGTNNPTLMPNVVAVPQIPPNFQTKRPFVRYEHVGAASSGQPLPQQYVADNQLVRMLKKLLAEEEPQVDAIAEESLLD
jgi:hypothetical protein